MAMKTPSYPFGKGKNKFIEPVKSRASKVNTREMGRGRVPANRYKEAQKGRRV